MTANVPISDTGTSIIGSSVARQSCRKIRTTMNTRMNASESVLYTSWTDSFDEDRGVVDDAVLHALRESAASSRSISARMLSAVASALEPGSWKTRERDRRLAVEVAVHVVVLGAELDARHVARAA